MTTAPIKFAKCATVAVFALAASCNPGQNSNKAIDKPVSQASGFKLAADICGQFLSLGDLTPTKNADGMRPMTMTMQIGVCGTVGSSNHPWKALGMTVVTPFVQTRGAGSTSYDVTDANKGMLFLDDKDGVLVQHAGKYVHFGQLSAEKHASLISLDANAKVELAIRDHAYSMSDPKSTPDSDKHVWVSEDGLE